jgi:hypothetical protein
VEEYVMKKFEVKVDEKDNEKFKDYKIVENINDK